MKLKILGSLGQKGDPDSQVFETAVQKDAILVTRDLEFGSPEHYEVENYEGLVIVRLAGNLPANKIARKVVDSLQEIGFKDLNGRITVLESGRYRTREI